MVHRLFLLACGLLCCLVMPRVASVVDISTLDVFTCLSNEIYDPISGSCVSCPTNGSALSGKCVCDSGFALAQYAGAASPVCLDCASQGKTVSPLPAVNGSQFCAECGGLDLYESSTYNADLMQCECPSGYSLATTLSGAALSTQICLPCSTSSCVDCTFPYVATDDGTCQCIDGYETTEENNCVPSSIYAIMQEQAASTSMSFYPQNLNNGGSSGSAVGFYYTKDQVIMSAASCSFGNQTQCQFLANMCVLMLYRRDSTPCALYLYIKRNRECLGTYCEESEGIPWLYYLQSSASLLNSVDFSLKAWSPVKYVVSVYTVEGQWLGYRPLVDELNPCHRPNTDLITYARAGSTLRMSCNMNWDWFLVANRTLLYELFMVDPTDDSKLVPIPALVQYRKTEFDPESFLDSFFFRAGWSITDVSSANYAPSNGYHRRFYVYDNVATMNSELGYPIAITSSQSISLVMGTTGFPFLVIQYASHLVGDYDGDASIYERVPLSLTSDANTVTEVVRAFYLNRRDTYNTTLKYCLIVMCILCAVLSAVRTYGWMRRRQNLAFDFKALGIFCVYFLDYLGNTLLFVVCLTSWVLLILFKSQSTLTYAVRRSEVYLTALLATSVSAKAIAIVYRIMEQCNADYYIIDWERSKGQLLRENALTPVSMWRSNFLAHQLSQVQCMRFLHPLLVMTIAGVFLDGFHFTYLSLGIPQGKRLDIQGAVSIEALRVAVDSLFLCGVALVLYIIEFQVYYRFFVVHPFQAFVDLCSVSNISVMILLEPMWGFYIHGRSIHAHADVNMADFQKNLSLEAEGNLPVRGLGGQSQCQVFEVFLGPYMRQYLYMCRMEMDLKCLEGKAAAKGAIIDASSWHFFGFLFRKKSNVYSHESMAIRDHINQTLQRSVHSAEGFLFSKPVLHRLLDVPPNIMYMNGALRGESGTKDLFFYDQGMSFVKAFLCYLDFDLFVLYTAVFTLVDVALDSLFFSILSICALEFVLVLYRHGEGKWNLCSKTLTHECFL